MRHKASPSPRALQILELMAGGMTLVEVARHLYITESTAKTHQRNAFALLGAHTATHAVAVAAAEGMIRLPAPRTPEQVEAALHVWR